VKEVEQESQPKRPSGSKKVRADNREAEIETAFSEVASDNADGEGQVEE